MIYRNFDELVEKVQKLHSCHRVALAGAHDAHSIEAVVEAQKGRLCEPVLIGKAERVKETLSGLGLAPADFEIVDSGEENPGKVAVEYVRDGKADFLMKGGIDTKDLLKPLVSKENNLTIEGRILSGFAIAEIPNYPKLITSVDGGVVIYPDLEQKKQIILNTVETLNRLGYENPKIAVLCGVEVVNPKMIETVHAAELVRMNRSGELPGCTVVGPISYDLIMSKESAQIKGYDSTYCGDFDVILSHILAAANMIPKIWVYNAGARWAGLIVGAKVPVVLVSRGSSAEEKFLSIALAALTCGGAS